MNGPFDTFGSRWKNELSNEQHVVGELVDALNTLSSRLNALEANDRQLKYSLQRMEKFMEYAMFTHPEIMKDYDNWERAKERLVGSNSGGADQGSP